MSWNAATDQQREVNDQRNTEVHKEIEERRHKSSDTVNRTGISLVFWEKRLIYRSASFFIRKNTQEREIYRFQDMEGGENFAGNTV